MWKGAELARQSRASFEPSAVLETRARDNQILPDDQIRAVVVAALAIDEDCGRLVVLHAATGARFAQVRRMVVADVQPDHGRHGA